MTTTNENKAGSTTTTGFTITYNNQINKTTKQTVNPELNGITTNSVVTINKNEIENPLTTTRKCSPSNLFSLDNEIKGNPIEKKEPKNIRLIFQNINSLRANTTDKWKATLDQMETLECDIVGLCETCINWNLNKTHQIYKSLLNRKFPNSTMIGSKIHNTVKKNLLPGGTASITMNTMVNRIENEITDGYAMGRWTGYQYNIGNNRSLFVISAYRVIDQQVNISNQMASNSQQHHMLQLRGICNTKPKRQFIIDFCEQFETICNNQHNYVILTLDANEHTDLPDKGGLSELMDKCSLTNLYQHVHNDQNQFPTHERGTKTIDYILGTTNLFPFITRIGYLRFHECFDSDHRGIYCDLSNQLFNNKSSITKSVKKRMVGTNSTNYEGSNYIKQLYEHLVTNNNIYNKSIQLLDRSKHNDVDNIQGIKMLNELDEVLTTSMLRIEKRTCKKKDPGLWTPAMKQSNLLVQYWNIRIKATRNNTNCDKRIGKILSQMDTKTRQVIINNTMSLSSAIKRALENHQKLCDNNHKNRQEYLQSIVDDLKTRNNTGHTSVTQLKQREKSRNDYRVIRNALKPNKSKGINYLDIPNPNKPDEWIRLVDPAHIEKAILERNISHFNQANNTPFAKKNLKAIFGYKGTNDNATKLINKQQIPKNLQYDNIYVEKFINKLHEGTNTKVDKLITFEEFISAINKWKERTTTSPSGRHLGHYKLMTKLNVYNEIDITINMSLIILKIIYNIMMTAIYLGQPLNRWKEVTTFMIQKIPNVSKINKLRVIHIYEADYNLMLKIMWARKQYRRTILKKH
jgi:hypothetical protein